MDSKKILTILGILILIIIGAFIAASIGTDERENGNGDNGGIVTGQLGEKFGLAFDVPQGYDVIEAEDPSSNRHSFVLSHSNDGGIPEDGEGPPAITIDIFEDVDEGTRDWLEDNNISNFNLLVGEAREMQIDGTPAVAFDWDGLYRGRGVVFKHQGNLILVSGTYFKESDPIFSDFDRVVSSIRLVEQ